MLPVFQSFLLTERAVLVTFPDRGAEAWSKLGTTGEQQQRSASQI